MEVRTKDATYRLPLQQLDIPSLIGSIGDSATLQDLTVQLEIAKPTTVEACSSRECAGKLGKAAPLPARLIAFSAILSPSLYPSKSEGSLPLRSPGPRICPVLFVRDAWRFVLAR
ncbi:hypothetical protein [Paenibacillus dokdonensis]|uniref:hypothetical protein n=1 Tax=Paenibacillus dokdonensis TaxID=2567944 RepID=UPI0010A83E05|nr:hypothetical protein [Paenibacillus dokdonensis]